MILDQVTEEDVARIYLATQNSIPQRQVVNGNAFSDVITYAIDFDAIAEDNKKRDGLALITVTEPVIKHTGYRGDAGIDLFAPYDFICTAGSQIVVNTYIRFLFPDDLYGRILPRGGDKFLVGSGVIDTGYTGHLKVRIVNPYSHDMVFKFGDSIGQLVPMIRTSTYGSVLNKVTTSELLECASGDRGESGRINGK